MVNREEAPAPARRLVFAYYITGHGFGHATRALEVRLLAPVSFMVSFRVGRRRCLMIDSCWVRRWCGT
jgi:hypothetical protein